MSSNPSTVTEKMKRGMANGTSKKRKVKEEHTDLGMLMWYTSFMCHFKIVYVGCYDMFDRLLYASLFLGLG